MGMKRPNIKSQLSSFDKYFFSIDKNYYRPEKEDLFFYNSTANALGPSFRAVERRVPVPIPMGDHYLL